MTDAARIEPCPFCGSRNARAEDVGYGMAVAIVCRECDANGPSVDYSDDEIDRPFDPDLPIVQRATDRWNRRHD